MLIICLTRRLRRNAQQVWRRVQVKTPEQCIHCRQPLSILFENVESEVICPDCFTRLPTPSLVVVFEAAGPRFSSHPNRVAGLYEWEPCREFGSTIGRAEPSPFDVQPVARTLTATVPEQSQTPRGGQ